MTMRPEIANDDRGITVNKSLAWTLIVGLVGLGFWVGTQLTILSSGMDQYQSDSKAAAIVRSDLESRVRGLETRESRAAAITDGVRATLSEIKVQQSENNDLLRQLLQRSMDK